MHPELQAIEEQYLSLVSATQAGHMSEDEAVATIARVTAVDGDGAVWSIDPYSGQFTRAFPGQAPEPANPSLFAPSRLPSPPVDFGFPGGMPAGPSGPAGWPTAPGLGPDLAFPPGAGPGRAPVSERGRGGLASLVKGRGRTLALLGAVVLVVLVIFVAKSGGSSGPEAVPEPGVSAVEAVPSAPPAVPADAPSAEAQARIVEVLGSGKQKLVLSLLGAVPDKAGTLLSTAGMSGARALGFTLEPAGVQAAPEGVLLSVRAIGAGSPRGTFTVPLVRAGEGWAVSGPVVFTPAR